MSRLAARLGTSVAVLVLAGCVGLPPAVERHPSFAIANGASTSLGRLARKDAPGDARQLSGFRLLSEAAFAFDARVALLRNAERSIDMQYYLIRNDDVGLLLLKELRDAATRGVRVRLLVDDLYAGDEQELFSSLAAFPNVEVRLFNPLPSRAENLPIRLAFSVFSLLRINHRMHNKLVVADNSFAITGGRNVGNEYFMRNADANFIDIDVLSSGPIVTEMSRSFDEFWNSDQVRTVHELVPLVMPVSAAQRKFDEMARGAVPDVALLPRDAFGRTPVGEQIMIGQIDLHWAAARLYADLPGKLDLQHDVAFRGSVSEGALNAVAESRREVKILSPYFVPGAQGMSVLQKFVADGGHATVVTNSLGSTDEPLAYAGYEQYRSALLQIGVAVYEIAPEVNLRGKRSGAFGKSISRLHAKAAAMDDDRLFIGSMNLDHRSAAINTELGILIQSGALVKEFNELLAAEHIQLSYRLQLSPDGKRTQWLEQKNDGSDIVHEDVPGSFQWQRIKNWLLLPLLGEELL